MTQELFTQFTAGVRYIWDRSRIHNIQYEVSATLSVPGLLYLSKRRHGSSRLLEAQFELGDPCRDLSFFVLSSLNLMDFND
ncbi:hypothetical protein F2Q69_00051220 [Brassica cretica]|uniref:Uncharacterized protein n=1 Tax=Brassica cretica TaxID=69181 RepID=A0A8S9PY29_BRACR|nr:hypothetical protein F2Q69_00051220 [Brassica cretica]